MVKVILIAIGLLVIGMLGIAIKMLFNKDAEFRTSSCQALNETLEDKGISCGCGGQCSTSDQ